jgi:virginiamycin B lyase
MRRAARLIVIAALLSACSSPVASTAPGGVAATPTAAARITPAPTVKLPPVVDLASTDAKAFHVLPGPDFATVVGGDLFAPGIGDGIGRLDATGKQVATWTPPTDSCGAFDAGFGAVWSATCGAPGLVRIDVKTNKLTPVDIGGLLPESEASIGAGEGGVWMIIDGSPRKLIKVDPKTLKVAASYDIDGSPTGVRVGLGAVWVTDPVHAILHRFDPTTGKLVADITVGSSPAFFAVGEGAVWTMNQFDGTISRIDPATNTVIAKIEFGETVYGGDIAVGGGFLWLRGSKTLLFKIDPAKNEIVAVYGPESGSGSVAADDTAVWITAHDVQTVWRLPLP